MRKHVRKLEKESQENNMSVAKNIGDLSKRQQEATAGIRDKGPKSFVFCTMLWT